MTNLAFASYTLSLHDALPISVEQACALAKQEGARRAMVLPVSAPFHSRLLEPAAQVLQTALVDILLQRPQVTVINNVDVDTPTEPNEKIGRASCRERV